jgi:hypothetical protein
MFLTFPPFSTPYSVVLDVFFCLLCFRHRFYP